MTFNRIKKTNVKRFTPCSLGDCVLWLPFYKYGSEALKIWDQSGNKNNGTILGPMPSSYLKSNRQESIGWFFDGVDDTVNCGIGTGLDFGISDFTLSIWVRPYVVVNTNKRVLSRRPLGPGDGYDLYYQDGGGLTSLYLVNSEGAAVFCAVGTVSNEVWQHVVVTINRTRDEVNAYINAGVPSTTDISIITGTMSPTVDLIIGAYSDAYGKQEIGDIAFFKNALSVHDVTYYYNKTRDIYGV